jgi:hypothetical protein
MGKISQTLALLLTLIIAVSCLTLLMGKSASAQTPPAPTFTVSTPCASHQVPTTYSTDPYTGATITNQGYTVNSINITFTIQNTPKTSFYLLQYKGHFEPQWNTLYQDGYNITAFASDESETVIKIFGTNSSGPLGQTPANKITLYFSVQWAINLALGSQLDFRLQAISGSIYISPIWGANHQMGVGNASDWSEIQTVTIPTGSNVEVTQTPTLSPAQSPALTPTASPSPQGNGVTNYKEAFFTIGIVAVTVVVVAVASIYFKTHKRKS